MSRLHSLAKAALAATILGSTASAQAAPLTFDCDVPANRFSSVSSAVGSPVFVAGLISPLASRRDRFSPLGGVLIEDGSSSSAAGFQLVSPEDASDFFDVVLISKSPNQDFRQKVGQVALAERIPFSFAISASGLATLNVGNLATNIEFMQMQSGTAQVLCTSGQFKFEELVFE